MPFTLYDNPRVEERIRNDLRIIREMVATKVEGIVALILVGGFGRGEGTVKFINGEPYPQNDYDVVVVTNKKMDSDSLKSSGAEIASRIGIWHIDLIPINQKRISKLPFTMFNYDFKYGGYVFYGDREILEKIPEMKAEDMPPEEAKILLFNRQLSFLECIYNAFPLKEPEGKEKDFLIAQCCRVLHACCDSALVLNKKYVTSYQEKLKNYKSIFAEQSSEFDLIKSAIDYKLWGKLQLSISPVELWFKVKESYLLWQKRIYQICSGRKWHRWEAMIRYSRTNPKTLLLRMGMILIRHSLKVEDKLLLDELGLYLVLSLENKQGLIDNYWLERTKRCVLKMRKQKRPEHLDWLSLVQHYSHHRGA